VLEESPDLTPGDFVRSVKQLIDLLDQIAKSASRAPADPPADPPAESTAAPSPRSLSATARSAIDAMRRGVVAYSAVAD
jgi:ATP-dependent RNA helicase HelY